MSRQKKTGIVLLCCALIGAMLLFWVLRSAGSGKPEEAGFTISVTGGGEDTFVLNTAATDALNGLSACRHLFEGLYKLDKTGQVVLGQASEAAVSSDGLTWRFTLRSDATWSDGRRVSARDFLFAWDVIAESGSYGYLFTDVVDSCEAPDENTIVLHLKAPCSFLPCILAFPSTAPIRRDYWEQYGDAYATAPEKAVYNGPFILSEWNHESAALMRRREDYYDSKSVALDAIRWELMTEERTAMAEFEQGELAFSALCPDEEKGRLADNGLFYAPGFNSYCVMFNLGPKGPDVLKDVRIRKALSLSIDRSFIVSMRAQNDEIGKTFACSGFVDQEGKDYTEHADDWMDVEAYRENCEEARALLKAAGYENGKNFPHLTYLVNSDSRREVAEAVVHDWQTQLGISSVTVERTDNLLAARFDGDFDLAYFGWYMDYEDLSNLYGILTDVADNNAFWHSEEYDRHYEAALEAPDLQSQWEHYAVCERVLSEELPVTVLLHSKNSYLFADSHCDGLVYSCGNYVFTYLTEKQRGSTEP